MAADWPARLGARYSAMRVIGQAAQRRWRIIYWRCKESVLARLGIITRFSSWSKQLQSALAIAVDGPYRLLNRFMLAVALARSITGSAAG
jgi:hypothetical protein